MKFVDEALVYVKAGNGGSGCISFRREKFIPLGGPDGGDGGDGGSIYFIADSAINTLIEFRYKRRLEAGNGQPGMGRSRRGKSAEDLIIPVPVGTVIYDADTHELIGDLITAGQKICVAKGGFHGIGNERFKSSTQRSPRISTPGTTGEERNLKLELKLLADVGLLGLPNAGKSTLIRQISNATPRVADYPFTTLHPHLGVVRVGEFRSFVISDLPGLIEGASQGTGLGLQFLKHLTRCRVLVHLVDMAPTDEISPVQAIQTVLHELKQFDPALSEKPRWLVFNKSDLLLPQEAAEKCQQIIQALEWQGPVYQVSAATGDGTKKLCLDLMNYLDQPDHSTK